MPKRSRNMGPFAATVGALLAPADTHIGGERPWDLRVNEPRMFAHLLTHGSLGLGESYMDGWWDCDDLDGLLYRMLKAKLDERPIGLATLWTALRARVINLQSSRRSFAVGRCHYDIGNDLYQAMLGKRLVYSCGYWRQADTLDDAQVAKLELICRKLKLAPGMRVLDIGCGWGELLKFAAERYGVAGVGVTVSREQVNYGRSLCAGLPVDIQLRDYREVRGQFDRVVSIGMFEHVGRRNYRAFFELIRACLPRDGLALLHTIGGNRSVTHTDPWIGKYIFPNSMLPSAVQITRAIEDRLVIEDWHNFGADYDLTLQAWRTNIEAAWDRLPTSYDERFRRMWRYYLAASMALFRTRRGQLWQLVLSPDGVDGGYVAPR